MAVLSPCNPAECPEQFVMAIFSQLGLEKINKNISNIHRAFYDFKSKQEYAAYLKEFRFNEMGLTPFSDFLDYILNALELSGILVTSNPSYGQYTLNVKYLEAQFQVFGEDDQKKITEMGAKLKEYINC